jgi:hypothetical protein
VFNPTHYMTKSGETFSPSTGRMVKYRKGEKVEVVNRGSVGGWAGPRARAVEVRTRKGDTLLVQPFVVEEIRTTRSAGFRKRLVRLACEKPEFRRILVPLLREDHTKQEGRR